MAALTTRPASMQPNFTLVQMTSHLPELGIDELPAEIDKRVSEARHLASETVRVAVHAGALLTRAKELVPHGQWDDWLRSNCTVAPRTAQAYMRLFGKLAAMSVEMRNAVADLPLREAMKAIVTAPTAPPRAPSRYQPRREERDRAANTLRTAAAAQRKLASNLSWRPVKRKDVEHTRAKVMAALAALDALQVGDDTPQIVDAAEAPQ